MRKFISLIVLTFICIVLASCNEPVQCEHTWISVTCTSPKLCVKCGVEGEIENHIWWNATCMQPKTCIVCGETDGSENPHVWIKSTCLSPKACVICGTTEGNAKEHCWIEATCTTPKICLTCEEVQGTTIAHDWKEATCDKPKFCLNCGITDGDKLNHDWTNATCISAKICLLCNKTEGEAILENHIFGEWKITREASCTEEGIQIRQCDLCKLQETVSLSITEHNFINDECSICKINTVLDSGKCGEDLYWELFYDGNLHIYGNGSMYDYIKYTTPSPWYKYRNEPYISEDGKKILNPDGSEYLSTTDYYKDNPNGYKIKKITIDEGVTYIGDWAFYRVCVDELTIPEGVTSTGYFCIRYSPTLKIVNLPNSLKTLNDFGISRNQELTTINFGNGLERIGRAGLQNNAKLESVILPESLISINEQMHEAYNDMNISNLGLLDSCISLKNVSLGSVVSIPQRTFINTSIETITIPNETTYIGEYAFYNCSKLKSVIFENDSQCTLIESNAFSKCPILESIIGCNALEIIKENAFSGSNNLQLFEFSNSNLSFGKNLFLGKKLETASLGEKMVVGIRGLFMSTNIKSLYISKSVVELQYAFLHSCTSLKDIYYDGTLEEWNLIIKENYWSYGVADDCVVHFSDNTSKLLREIS